MTLPLAPTQAALLAELKRRLGDYAVEGWEHRSGDELYQAIARVFSHLAERTRIFALSATFRRASGPSRHRLTLRLTWSAANSHGWTLSAGQVLFETAWGARFRLTEDLTRNPAAPPGTLDIEAEAEWAGVDFRVAPHTVTHFALPQTANSAASLQWRDTDAAGQHAFLSSVGATGAKPWLSVTNPDTPELNAWGLPTKGGPGLLDLLAMERGLPREPGESDALLRARIRDLPDILTPAALLRSLEAAFLAGFAEHYGGSPGPNPIALHEPWTYGDAPSLGACGVHPPTRAWSFMVTIPALPYRAIGDAPAMGACAVHPCGSTGEAEREALLSALSALIQRTKAPGIWGALHERQAH